jgi:arylsulfatase
MDQGIGRILASLEKHGWRENTLVVFLSDNGASPERIDACSPCAPAGSRESYLSYGEPWAWVSNAPFRHGKARVHEGGIASPFIARWPARFRGTGRIVSDLGHVIDIAPTCLEAARAPPLTRGPGGPARPIEGRSLLPVLEGRAGEASRALFWEHQGNQAVRRGRWKLVRAHNRPWELHDIDTDRTELRDLAREKPDIVAELERLYESWAERCGVLPWGRRARV